MSYRSQAEYQDGHIEIYVRAGGSDSAPGTLAAPLATVVEAFSRLRRIGPGSSRQIIDCTGVDENIEAVVAPLYVGGYPSQLDFAPAHPLFFSLDSIELRAVPTVIATVTINSNDPGPTPGQRILSVDEVLVPGAHVGQMVTGAAIFEGGVIYANDADSLSVTTLDALPGAGALDIIEPSATLTYGDPAIFSRIGFELAAVYASITITGIRFRNNNVGAGNYSLEARSRGNTSFVACDFDGVNLFGPDYTFDYCHVVGDWQTNGAAGQFRSSFFEGASFFFHGDAGFGTNVWNGCVFDTCSAIGHGTTQEQVGGFDIRSSLVESATADGIRYAGGAKCLIKDTVVQNSVGDGILAENVGSLEIDNVDGAANGGVGVQVRRGASVQHAGNSAITGVGGDIDLSGAALTWAGIGPAEVDNDSGSRLLDIS